MCLHVLAHSPRLPVLAVCILSSLLGQPSLCEKQKNKKNKKTKNQENKKSKKQKIKKTKNQKNKKTKNQKNKKSKKQKIKKNKKTKKTKVLFSSPQIKWSVCHVPLGAPYLLDNRNLSDAEKVKYLDKKCSGPKQAKQHYFLTHLNSLRIWRHLSEGRDIHVMGP